MKNKGKHKTTIKKIKKQLNSQYSKDITEKNKNTNKNIPYRKVTKNYKN